MKRPGLSERGLRGCALALFALVIALDLGYVLASRGIDGQPGLTYSSKLDRDEVIGILLPGVVGLVLCWARPRNPIGWLLTACGLALGLCDLGSAYGARSVAFPDESLPGGTWALSLLSPFWVWAVFLPVSLLLARYPSGRIEGRWARRFDRAVMAGGLVLWLGYATGKESVSDTITGGVPPVLFPQAVSASLLAVGIAAMLVGTLFILGDAVRRAVRGTRDERLSLLWLLTTAVLAVVTIWFAPLEWMGSVAYFGILVAVAVGVLRYGALGIDVVIRRTLVYAILTGLVLVVFAGVVAGLTQVMPEGALPQLVAATLVAVGLGPARDRIQGGIDRVLYGERSDPFAAMRTMGTPLTRSGTDLVADVLSALAQALRVPEVTLEPPGEDGVPLLFGGEELGRLRTQPRRGENSLGLADTRLVEAVAPLVAALLHGARATQAERGRLRQELHDGLGPSLTGIGLGLEAAQRNGATPALLSRLREEVTTSLEEVRRIIDDLAPVALEHADLLAALRRRAEQVNATAVVQVELDTPHQLPELHPSIAAAAFRIADEALTNVVRHSSATHCWVRLRVDDGLHLEVNDDGVGPGPARDGGVGLASMRERAERLGGRFSFSATPPGTTVLAELPLVVPA